MLRHICIEVKNMPVDLVAQFYVEHFGMKVVYHATEKWLLIKPTWEPGTSPRLEVALKIIKLKAKGSRTLLELVQHHNEWAPHICIEVDEWPEKVHLIEPHRLDKEHKGMEVRFCSDPALNMIELVRRIK
jgi:catechol 2,3-dioxygenase-like lactoylglutathione lyase family enzyme